VSRYDALLQEHRAWAHLGATPRDLGHDVAAATAALTELEEKHGGPDPKRWRWGPGLPLADVFAADEAAREHTELSDRAEALRSLAPARERSRSPQL